MHICVMCRPLCLFEKALYTCLDTRLQTHTHIRTHIHTYVYIYIYIYICIHTHTHIYIYIYTYVCVYVCMCVYICMNTHTCMHMSIPMFCVQWDIAKTKSHTAICKPKHFRIAPLGICKGICHVFVKFNFCVHVHSPRLLCRFCRFFLQSVRVFFTEAPLPH